MCGDFLPSSVWISTRAIFPAACLTTDVDRNPVLQHFFYPLAFIYFYKLTSRYCTWRNTQNKHMKHNQLFIQHSTTSSDLQREIGSSQLFTLCVEIPTVLLYWLMKQSVSTLGREMITQNYRMQWLFCKLVIVKLWMIEQTSRCVIRVAATNYVSFAVLLCNLSLQTDFQPGEPLSEEGSKKVGVLYIVNQLFSMYFQLNTLRLCKNLLKWVSFRTFVLNLSPPC